MTHIVGVYNADGSILGELKFAVSKVIGRNDCGLCDLTHGWNPFGKPSWKSACSASSIEIELLHQDELTEGQREAAGDLPAVIVGNGGAWQKIMAASDIITFHGNASGFLTHIESLVDGV